MNNPHIEVIGALPLRRQLSFLQMPAGLRRRLLARVVKKVVMDSKKRVREQRDLSGSAYPERYRERTHNRRKMLSRLVKQLKVISADSNSATAGFYNPVAGGIAAAQQEGKTEQMNASQFGSRSAASYQQPATRRMAKILLELGFKIRKANGRTSRPSIKYITENLKQGRAGAIISAMRAKQGLAAHSSWITRLPARSFLGATAADVQTHIETIYNTMEQEIARGIR